MSSVEGSDYTSESNTATGQLHSVGRRDCCTQQDLADHMVDESSRMFRWVVSADRARFVASSQAVDRMILHSLANLPSSDVENRDAAPASAVGETCCTTF